MYSEKELSTSYIKQQIIFMQLCRHDLLSKQILTLEFDSRGSSELSVDLFR